MWLAFLLLGAGQAAAPEVKIERLVGAMGTSLALHVHAVDRGAALEASERAIRAVQAVEARFSTWTEESELARVNCHPVGQALNVSAEMVAALAEVSSFRDLTGGCFDPAVGSLVQAWDLRGAGRIPSPSELTTARVAANPIHLELLPSAIRRRHKNFRLEEGGFAKGLALDAAARELRNLGVQTARLDLGGQVLVLGQHQSLLLADPRQRDRAVLRIDLGGGSLATSGNCEHGLTVGDQRIGHILDPRSGAPAPDFGSMSVWAESALAADCLSTALFVMGPQAAWSWLAEHPEYAAIALLVVENKLVARVSPSLHKASIQALVAELELER